MSGVPGGIAAISHQPSTPRGELDKMIQHQKDMFSLDIQKELAKSEHDMKMGIAGALGQASQKA